MGFKTYHLNTHADSIEVMVPTLKTNANSNNYLLVLPVPGLVNALVNTLDVML